MGHEIDRERNQTERRKSRSNTEIEITGKHKRAKVIPRSNTIYGQIFTEILPEQTDRLRKLLKKNEPWNWGEEQEKDFGKIKQLLTEGPC